MTNPPKKPYENSRMTKYLVRRILELRPRKTQSAIATEAGFVNVNMLSMIKNGTNKLPLDRVPGLAKGLECDPAYLFLLALEQVFGSSAEATIRQIFGTLPTRNEVQWLQALREASDNSDPNLTARAHRALREIFGK